MSKSLSPRTPTEKAKIWAPPGRPNGQQELKPSCLSRANITT